MLEIKREKVGKGNQVYDYVAVVNGKGNVVAGSSFAREIDADAAVAMIEALLGYDFYPCVPYEETRNTVDSFFKKLADGKDPFTFDKNYDGGIPTKEEMYQELRQKMAEHDTK